MEEPLLPVKNTSAPKASLGSWPVKELPCFKWRWVLFYIVPLLISLQEGRESHYSVLHKILSQRLGVWYWGTRGLGILGERSREILSQTGWRWILDCLRALSLSGQCSWEGNFNHTSVLWHVVPSVPPSATPATIPGDFTVHMNNPTNTLFSQPIPPSSLGNVFTPL